MRGGHERTRWSDGRKQSNECCSCFCCCCKLHDLPSRGPVHWKQGLRYRQFYHNQRCLYWKPLKQSILSPLSPTQYSFLSLFLFPSLLSLSPFLHTPDTLWYACIPGRTQPAHPHSSRQSFSPSSLLAIARRLSQQPDCRSALVGRLSKIQASN
ncbi:unnamed protein product [Protopolystoma xenopodis]|uniref:Uncharacterized protein n=1 Tax=Protopolystoma xenopodis TaxID=117903 RepID=A0A3S5AW47_9PLAT|nr:unnamed protein product [Protopolystoma xenopodis]